MAERDHIPRRRSAGRVIHMLSVIGTLVIILAMVAALAVYRPLENLVDSTQVDRGSAVNTVDQTQLISYCPARMRLPDTGSFGDAQFQTSSGDLASAARYGAFGSAYRSTVGTLAQDSDTATDLQDGDSVDDLDVKMGTGNADDGSRLVVTHLLASQIGSGSASSVASWATKGDLRGLAVSSCVSPEPDQTLMLPETAAGVSQQLVVANPSAKATSVELKIWGTSQTGALNPSTNSAFTVRARSETTVDLTASAPDQDGLFVTVSSADTPVSAVVRVVKMQGLNVRGSEFIDPSAGAFSSSVLAGVRGGDRVSLTVFAHKNPSVSLSWVTPDGLIPIDDVRMKADAVSHVDLGTAPNRALALVYNADSPIWAQAQTSRSGSSNQQDVAYLSALRPTGAAAVAVPGSLSSYATIVNPSDGRHTADITTFSADGGVSGTRKVTLKAHSAVRITMSDIARDTGAVVIEQQDAQRALTWSMAFEQPKVNAASVAGIAVVSPSSLEPSGERIESILDQRVVR